jgi:hypothetical protein
VWESKGIPGAPFRKAGVWWGGRAWGCTRYADGTGGEQKKGTGRASGKGVVRYPLHTLEKKNNDIYI